MGKRQISEADMTAPVRYIAVNYNSTIGGYTMDFFSVLTLLGGLAMFLYGMDVMGDHLKKLAGGKLEMFLAKLTSNRFKGFLLGLFVTAIIQSSSATTVMLVGFVNSGLMRLGQTISIILGADIGTTVTAWLLSLGGISGDSFWIRIFKPTSFTPVLAAVGVVMLMACKQDKHRDIASILIGFAVLMFGMDTMSGAMSGLKNSPTFAKFLIMFSNPVMGIIAGALFTAIIQSSSASVGILQALSLTVAIPYSTAIPIILGQNIGTTITPILSSITGNTDAKRVAMACLYIKLVGVIVIGVLFYVLHMFVSFDFMNESISILAIAFVHTLFNVMLTLIVMPCCSLIEKLTIMTIKGKEKPENDIFAALDDRFLEMPSFAVEKCRSMLCDMANIAKNSLADSTDILHNYDTDGMQAIYEQEDLVDKYEDKLSTYLVKLAGSNVSADDSKEITELLHCIGDIERISDHAVNICDVAKEIHDKKIVFGDNAKHDIRVISSAVRDILSITTAALVDEDLKLATMVEPLEQVIDRLKHKIKNNQIKRLRDGESTVEMGFILSDLLTNYERVADHCSNIAVCLLETANGSFDTHEYLSHVKENDENDFGKLYEQYKAKYSL